VLDAVRKDYRTAPVDERLRATLAFVEKLCRDPRAVGAADAARVLDAGVSPDALRDAVWVCTIFSIFTRAADGLGWDLMSKKSYDIAADHLWTKGYIL
jgi:alkylhydroperoxidase family enzyme